MIATKSELDKAPYREYDVLSRWPLRYIERTKQYFIEIDPPSITPAEQWVPIVDVTDLAPRLVLNRGHIAADGGLLDGPGEAYAHIGSEGPYVTVALRDGTGYARIEHLAVSVQIHFERLPQ